MRTEMLIAMNLPSEAHDYYRHTLDILKQAQVPVLVGGAFALAHHTGVQRFTKDFDLFVYPRDCERALGHLRAAGYQTELTFPHWLGKAFSGEFLVDLIFSSGNGLCRVDEGWFSHATQATVLGVPVEVVPPEEMIWSKAFVQERERFDGADIAHVIRSTGRHLDWRGLLARFGPHWRVLYAHLVLFGFIYPTERDAVPAWLLEEMAHRLRHESNGPAITERICQGTLLSREQYLADLREWGYADPRETPRGNLRPEDVTHWTAAIGH
jgi:Nucleotidyl transferase of unknown function (DUF2204)